MKCKHCGGEMFTAHQLCRMDVLVNESGDFLSDMPDGPAIYDAENPYGPFQCCGCGAEYDELAEGEESTSGPIDGWTPIQLPSEPDTETVPCMNKIVVFRSEGGRYIDMIVSVENFDDRFNTHARNAVDEWYKTDEEFCTFVVTALKKAGYTAHLLEYEDFRDD